MIHNTCATSVIRIFATLVLEKLKNDGDVPVEGGNWQAKPHGTYSPRISSGVLDCLTGAQFCLVPEKLVKMVFIQNLFPAL